MSGSYVARDCSRRPQCTRRNRVELQAVGYIGGSVAAMTMGQPSPNSNWSPKPVVTVCGCIQWRGPRGNGKLRRNIEHGPWKVDSSVLAHVLWGWASG